jgi:hypothetical protein
VVLERIAFFKNGRVERPIGRVCKYRSISRVKKDWFTSKGLRMYLLALASLLFVFSMEMVSELQRDGKGRSSRGWRGVGRLQQHLPLKVNFLKLFIEPPMNLYVSKTFMYITKNINCVKNCGKNDRHKSVSHGLYRRDNVESNVKMVMITLCKSLGNVRKVYRIYVQNNLATVNR